MTDLPSNKPSGRTSYDETPYPSTAYPQTHPNRLAAMARLFGVDAPSPLRARVLELGCADGSNLLPMAEMAPGASFLGIDASPVQIAEGVRVIEATGLKNVALRVQSILDFPASEGKFDYIIAHGVFSWVPEPVREKLLAICRDHLTENGVAYVSYNALPGWNMRRSVRDMALYHTKPFRDAQMKVQQARAVIGFLAQSVPDDGGPYGLLLRNELKVINNRSDAFLRHDLLEENNAAFYFHDFIARAGRHSLQFLSETSLSQMLAQNFAENVSKKLAEVGRTIIEQEQYMDFLKNRRIRETLLCRREVALARNVDPSRVKGLSFQSALKPAVRQMNAEAGVEASFTADNGAQVTTRDPILKVVLYRLAQHGAEALSYSELSREARRMTDKTGETPSGEQMVAMDTALTANLANLLGKGLLEAFAEPVVSAVTADEKPMLSALVRDQAMHATAVVNRLHQPISADGFVRNLIELCDGTRTGDQLLEALIVRAQDGGLDVSEAGHIIKDSARLRALLTPRVSTTVAMLAGSGFFAPSGNRPEALHPESE